MEVIVACGAWAVAIAPIPVARMRPGRMDSRAQIAVALLPLTEATGRILDLYEGSVFPYDIPAHALEVGAATFLVLRLVGPLAVRQTGQRPAAALSGILVGLALAVAWEAVGWSVHMLTGADLQHGVDDTLVDVAAGLVGAAFAGSLAAVRVRDG